jgi:hypothetical protein
MSDAKPKFRNPVAVRLTDRQRQAVCRAICSATAGGAGGDFTAEDLDILEAVLPRFQVGDHEPEAE